MERGREDFMTGEIGWEDARAFGNEDLTRRNIYA